MLTRDGKRAVATGFVSPSEPGAQGPLRVWDLVGMKVLAGMFVAAAYYPLMVLSADERLAIAATDKGRLDVWDLQTAARVREIEAHPGSYLASLHRLPDGTVATLDSKEDAADLRIWNVETGERTRDARIPHGAGRGAVFSDDGSFVLLAGKELAVWDLRAGETRATFTGGSEMSAIALGPDQKTVLAGDAEGGVMVLRIE